MVKLKGPALSIAATGSIGKALTLSSNKGRSYMRVLRKPAQPRTNKQISARAAVTFCSSTWAGLLSVYQATWDARAAALQISPFNVYVGNNTRFIRNDEAPSVVISHAKSDAIAGDFTWTMTGGVRRLIYTFHASAPVNQNWGAILYQNKTGIVTSSPEIIVNLFFTAGTSTQTWVQSPLPAGTHYSRIRLFSRLGVIGTQSGQKSAAVLDA